MRINEYQELARRTQREDLKPAERLQHALYGLASEVGEIHAIYQKKYQGHAVRTEKVIDEVGDLLWFAGELCDCLGVKMEYVCEANIAKLRKRYPQGFDAERSMNRDEQ